MAAKDRLIVALDVSTLEEAEHLVRELGGEVGWFKVGMQLFYHYGPRVVESIQNWGARVFLDLKLHDIPNTVAEAVRALTRLEVGMITLHTAGGREMMHRAVQAVREEAALMGLRPPLVLGVTVLTSLLQSDLAELGFSTSVRDVVVRWAGLAKESGLDGVVASAREAKALRLALGTDFVIVTPGIRPSGTAAEDQRRVTTPQEAIRAGANYLVVGRPVTQALDPVAAVRRLLQELEE
ncbi:MAG: orotidine-5'-phosphate decarboxylase [Moorellales bacterium]